MNMMNIMSNKAIPIKIIMRLEQKVYIVLSMRLENIGNALNVIQSVNCDRILYVVIVIADDCIVMDIQTQYVNISGFTNKQDMQDINQPISVKQPLLSVHMHHDFSSEICVYAL